MIIYNNKALRILLIFNSIFVFASSLLGPLYAIFVSGIDSKIMSVSFSWAAFLISTTICMLLLRKWGDSLKEKEYFIMASYLIRAIVWFLFPFISTLFMLVILQVILGIGEALGTPAFCALFAEHLDDGKHIEEFTDRKLMVCFSEVMGVLAGGIIVSKFGFKSLFMIMGILALISFIGILLQPRELL